MKSQPKNEKYANGSVGARVRLMVRGGCLPVRGSKGMDWKYDDDLCVCGTKETEIHVLFECKCYDMVRRRWLRTWDVLEEKERTMGVIKGYVEVNDDVENETMKYLGEVWTERQRNERNRVNVSFYHLAPALWNDLPLAVRETECRNTFKNRLDKHWRGHPMRLDYKASYDLGMRSPADQEEVIYEIASQA